MDRKARERHRAWPSGTGKTHVAIGLGLAACQKGLSVGSEVIEARDERRLLRFQKQMATYSRLILKRDEYETFRRSRTLAHNTSPADPAW